MKTSFSLLNSKSSKFAFISAILILSAAPSLALQSQDVQKVITQFQYSRLNYLNPVIIENAKLIELYRLRSFEPYWITKQGRKAQFATKMKYFFQQVGNHGLRSNDYLSKELIALENQIDNGNTQVAITYELIMTDAVLRFMQDVVFGRLPMNYLEREYKIQSKFFTDFQGLNLALNTYNIIEFESYIRQQSPQIHLYQNLLSALSQLRKIQTQNNWNPIYPQTTLKFGVKDKVIPSIRGRLNDLGYRVSLASDEFDYDLLNAVKEFQKLNGLQSDGIIGANGSTMRTLNVSLERRIDQIEQSLDKLRTLPKKLERRFVLINTAFAELKNYENMQLNLQFKTVVGRAFRRSPTKRDMLEEVIVNPTWTVPYRIFKRDKLEEIQSDLSYLEQNHIRIVDSRNNNEVEPSAIDWDSVNPDRFPYLLVQNPGLHNALGTIKFPLYRHNDDIYLHDTNERYLFNDDVIDRHKSSGCIRLEKPHDFAEYLLRANQDRQYSAHFLKSLAPPLTPQNEIKTERIRVKEPMPVYVIYMTAEATDAGQIRFYDDIYGQDFRFRKILQATLQGGH